MKLRDGPTVTGWSLSQLFFSAFLHDRPHAPLSIFCCIPPGRGALLRAPTSFLTAGSHRFSYSSEKTKSCFCSTENYDVTRGKNQQIPFALLSPSPWKSSKVLLAKGKRSKAKRLEATQIHIGRTLGVTQNRKLICRNSELRAKEHGTRK